jgi:hypothetical protein
MNWLEDMEHVRKPVWSALVMDPELITQGFHLPGGKHQ